MGKEPRRSRRARKADNHERKDSGGCVLGFTGFFYATTVPVNTTYTSAYVTECLIPQLTGEVTKTRRIIGLTGTVLHWDNARAHTSRETRALLEDKKVRVLPHPAYSPDLSPSDFFLFGTLKEKMKGTTFSNGMEVLDKIYELWSAIPKETFRRVFDNWKMRLNFVIKNNGEYYHEQSNNFLKVTQTRKNIIVFQDFLTTLYYANQMFLNST